jgi:predicted DNA-binding transcriptional regulator YafY
MSEEKAAWIDYTNWRGERAWRRVVPGALRFAATPWHPGPQWLLDAYDLDRMQERTFSLADIHEWRATPPEQSR